MPTLLLLLILAVGTLAAPAPAAAQSETESPERFSAEVEPNDRSEQAMTVEPNRGVRGAIAAAGDADWYGLPGSSFDERAPVTVTRTNAACASGALRATLLNPEGKPMQWEAVPPAGSGRTTFELPSLPGRYYVAVDATQDPGCQGATYEVEVPRPPVRRLRQAGPRSDRQRYACLNARANVNLLSARLATAIRRSKRVSARARRRYRRTISRARTALARAREAVQRNCD